MPLMSRRCGGDGKKVVGKTSPASAKPGPKDVNMAAEVAREVGRYIGSLVH